MDLHSRAGVMSVFVLLAAGCGSPSPVVILIPDFEADGWAMAVHHSDGSVEVKTRRTDSGAIKLNANNARRLEFLAYTPFELPLGDLPSASTPGLSARALPEPRATFSAEFVNDTWTNFSEVPQPSAELRAYRYGAPSTCHEFSTTLTDLGTRTGNSSAIMLPDGSALVSSSEIFFHVTLDEARPFSPCGLGDNYSSIRARSDGTFMVVGVYPARVAIVRFDMSPMRCEVVTNAGAPAPRRFILDDNQSGDPNAPIYALTSSGAIHRYLEDGTWALEFMPAPKPGPTLEVPAALLQIEPGVLAGAYDDPSFFLWSQTAGLQKFPLPDAPLVVQTPRVESMAISADLGLLVATGWGPIFRLDPAAPILGEPFQDFRVVAREMVPFRGGILAFLKEGPAVEFRGDEICLPGTTVSGGGLLTVAGSNDRIAALYREDEARVIRWLSP